MFKVIACIVIYDTEFEEIVEMIEEFFKENINQKLVIIDNSNTGYLKDEILKINNSIDYILSENVGYGNANNKTIEKYRGLADYFIVMNPDIFITINGLKKLIEHADTKKEFGIIMPKITYSDGEIQYLCKLLPTPWDLFLRRVFYKFSYMKKLNFNYEYRFTNYDKEVEVPVLSGCFMFCNYSNLSKENGFDDRFFMYLEDTDLSRRMFKYGNYFYPNVTVIHKFSRASYKSLKMTKLHIISMIKYFNKWGWIFDKERKKINHKMINKNSEGR